MNNQNMMELILIVCLLVSGYLLLLQAVLSIVDDGRRRLAVVIALLLIYGVISVVLVFMLTQMGGGRGYALMAVMLLMAMVTVGWSFMSLKRDWEDMNKGVLVLFFVYLLAVGYITLFSRGERNKTEIIASFDSLIKAIQRNNRDELQHFILNTALFVPLGFLLPFLCEDKGVAWICTLGMGLMLTALVESVQLVFRLGLSDVQDLAANALGMMVGCIMFYIYWMFARRFSR